MPIRVTILLSPDFQARNQGISTTWSWSLLGLRAQP